MAEPRTAILHRDGSLYYYENYADARAAASSANRDTIVIYADLPDEQIVLKDSVDIWIYPGVKLNNSSGDTITNFDGLEYQEIHCNIYGEGIILNTGGYRCIFIDNVDSDLSIECNYIENSGTAICIEILNANNFSLTCNKVFSQKYVAIWLGFYNFSNHTLTGFVNYVNLNISKVEGGITGFGTTVLISDCNGFMKIGEILSNYRGHALSHRAGEVTARIKKLTSIMHSPGGIATVHLDQGTDEQKLILYFDEILNLSGEALTASAIALHHHQGTGIFIGRKIYSKNDRAVDISGDNVKGYLKCNEIISELFTGIRFYSNTEQITVDANFIQGYSLYGCFHAQDDANVLLRNAKLINKDTTSSSRCIVLEKTDTLLPNITLNNVKAVTGNIDTGSIIFQAGFTGISIDNYCLFANKSLDSGVTLDIVDAVNYWFIESSDLT